MKRSTKKMGMIAGLLLFSGVAFGSTTEYNTKENSQYLEVKVTPNDRNIVFVNFEKLQNETVKIKIYDNRGALLHTEKVENDTAILKRYDISNLPSGVYSFEISNDVYMMRKKVDKK